MRDYIGKFSTAKSRKGAVVKAEIWLRVVSKILKKTLGLNINQTKPKKIKPDTLIVCFNNYFKLCLKNKCPINFMCLLKNQANYKQNYCFRVIYACMPMYRKNFGITYQKKIIGQKTFSCSYLHESQHVPVQEIPIIPYIFRENIKLGLQNYK